MAYENKHMDIVKYLVHHCQADASSGNSDGWTVLHSACYKGSLVEVRYFIEDCRVDATMADNEGTIAFHVACKHGHLDIIRYFIQNCKFFQYYKITGTGSKE